MRTFKKWFRVGSLAIVAGCVVAGCKQHDEGPDVVAKVNNVRILRSDLDKIVKQQIAGARQKITPEQENVLRLQIVQQLIGQQVFLEKAAKLGLTATDKQVDDRLNQEKAPFTKEEFAKKLQELGMSEDEVKRELRKQLTLEKLFEQITSKIVISDADTQSSYDAHKAEFRIAEPRYVLAHIFVTGRPVSATPAPGKAKNEAEARQKIAMAHARLEAGEDFAAVAAKYSEDPSAASNGGQITLTESQLQSTTTSAASRAAIAKLKPGEFSAVIPVTNPVTQRPEGYRIIKLIGKVAAGQRELSDPEVQTQIRNQLRKQREQYLKAAYDEAVRSGADIHNYYAERIVKDAGLK